MRPLWLAVVCLVTLAVTGLAAQRKTTFETITVSATAVGLASSTTSGMSACGARVETAAIRFRMDGTNPTATVGVPVGVGDTIEMITVFDAMAIRFIAQSGTATLSVWCWPK